MHMRWSILGLLLLPLAGVRADEVTDQLDAAWSAYGTHDIGSALAALDNAVVLLRQQRAESWKALLPAPLPGWTAEEANTTSLSPAMLGGVTSASRTYQRGGERVLVSILTDSPLLQGVGAMLSSVLSAGAGSKVMMLGGHRLTYLKDDNSYTTIVGDKVMVKVSADPGASEDALRQYAAAIDFAAIERATR